MAEEERQRQAVERKEAQQQVAEQQGYMSTGCAKEAVKEKIGVGEGLPAGA